MTDTRPLLVAMPLDHETVDVLRAASEIAQRMGAPIAPVHALSWRPVESDAALEERIGACREELLAHLETTQSEGVTVLEPVISRTHPGELAVETAQSINAQMIVTGGGGPATVRRWVVGSVAERIVRNALVPVWVARGALPIGRPLLCPVDLSPQSRLGFTLALRIARLFETDLTVLSVISGDGGYLSASELDRRLEREDAKATQQVEEFLNAHDLAGVKVTTRVTIGRPSECIIEASKEAALMVIGSRGFDLLNPGSLGSVTERALRFSRCTALTIRDIDRGRDRWEKALQRVAALKTKADALLAEGDAMSAIPLLQLAADRAPVNAAVQESLARALEGVGRGVEAESRRQLAELIRASFE